MGLRHRSIRLRVAILIVVPVLCLIALYGFAASITLGNALTEARAKSLTNDLLKPVGTFQLQLATERHLAVQSLAAQNSTKLASSFSMQTANTTQAFTAMKTAITAPSVQSEASPTERAAIAKLINDGARLSYIRNVVDASATKIPRALALYDAIINQGFLVLEGALGQEPSTPLVTQALDVIGLDQVAQTAVEESDLLSADVARHQFPEADRLTFGQLAYARTSKLSSIVPMLDPAYRRQLAADVSPATGNALNTYEGEVLGSAWRSGLPPPTIAAGLGVFANYSAGLGKAVQQESAELQTQVQNDANGTFAQLILAGGLGLLGIIASIVLSLFVGRGLVRQLRNLRESALDLANDKLPTVIKQLRDGQQVDLSDYVAPAEDRSRDEIEQVQHAFSIVQQTAVQSAVDEARLRRGISDVFRNLAGRSQSLLHRQLTLLDGMERRATEPEELEDLFRIDHLTTRMRRHAEGLIILSGETPARGWRQPVPLVDVLRAAVAEVEDYTRIRVLSRTRAAVAGHAVADVIHLIAELAENATVFSPPNTPVRIQGDVVGRGFAIEIEDRGLGISPERLDEINADLADPPQFDLSDSDRLGLFIAGQLAHRHGITVTLRPSVYGGTTAIVIIPIALVVDEDSFVPDAALPAGSQPDQLAGRHAALAGAERGRLTSGNGHAGSLAPEPAPAGLPTGSPFDVPSPSRVDQGPSPSPFSTPPSLPLRRRPVLADADASAPFQPVEASNGLSRDDHDATVSNADLADLGLPVRVRQANLAPQLREGGPTATPPAETSDEGLASPEAARSTMSALQRGWQLGRAEADSKDSATAEQQPIRGIIYRAQDGAEPPAAEPDDAGKQKFD